MEVPLPNQQVEPVADPRLQPTPDYGTLGPNSDVESVGAVPGRPSDSIRIGQVAAVAAGVLAAVLVGSVSSARAGWKQMHGFFAPTESPNALVVSGNFGDLDRMQPQDQAEGLLELAVSNSDGAVDQIFSRADGWRGKLEWNARFANLATAALNSPDLHVREGAIEAELAAYGLAKNSSSVDSLITQVGSGDHGKKIWALWALGLMANRGVESGRVSDFLTAHLKDIDEESRRWAVEGLALVGSTPTVVSLLQTMHDDSSASVRERAACSLAESGMLTHEQRMTAVPQLINYTDDPALDGQTHAWAFQALSDITHQRLPNVSASWREWYATAGGEFSGR